MLTGSISLQQTAETQHRNGSSLEPTGSTSSFLREKERQEKETLWNHLLFIPVTTSTSSSQFIVFPFCVHSVFCCGRRNVVFLRIDVKKSKTLSALFIFSSSFSPLQMPRNSFVTFFFSPCFLHMLQVKHFFNMFDQCLWLACFLKQL